MLRIRNLSLLALAVTLVALLGAPSLRAKDKKLEEAQALLTKAHELSDIRAKGSPPFRLRAEITALNVKGKPVQGSYSLDWASPERWRDEVHLEEYERVRVRNGDELWQHAPDRSNAAEMYLLDQ